MSLFSNILKIAFGQIPHSTIEYKIYASKSINNFGIVAPTYTTPATVEAIVQPGIISSFGGKCVELKDYKDMGLDWSRRYVTVWMPDVGLQPAMDQRMADQITYNSKTFNVLQVENWLEYDGWCRVYCVEHQT